MSMTAEGPDIFVSLVCRLAYAWCASRFLKSHLRGKSSEARGFAGFLFGGHAVMAIFLENRMIPHILYAICSHVLFIGLALAMFGEERGKKLLAAVILETMTGLIWNFGESFFSCASLIFIHIATGSGQATFLGTWVERGIVLLAYAGGITAVNLLSRLFSPVFSDKRKSWYFFMAVPLACIILLTDLINWGASNGIMVQDWGKYGLYENQLFSHGAMCLYTGLAMAAAGFFVFGMDKIDREEKAREQVCRQVAYYQMLEDQYSQMERLRHDLKNHLIALESLVQNRQWEKAGAYLKDMAKAGKLEAGDEATGSLVLDALLSYKRRQATERGIRWQCDARLPEDFPVKETDLCIIAGNILDNAVEACERLQEKKWEDRFIQIYMGTVKKCFFLEVRNSTDIADSLNTEKSRKKDSQNHGLGLANIKAAAANYNGAVHMEAEGGVFTISILLPLYHNQAIYDRKESI